MNIIEVKKNVLYRGPMPRTDKDIGQLDDLGIQAVLSLQRGWFEVFHGRLNWESIECINSDITPVQIHMGNLFPPSILEISAAVNMICLSSAPVYVHCLRGKDRTGIVCAAYRMSQGWTLERAWDEAVSLGFHLLPYGFWERRLREWAQWYI